MNNPLYVNLANHSYPIHIGRSLLASSELLVPHVTGRTVAIVTNATVAAHHLAPVQAALARVQIVPQVIQLPDGEAHKDWQTLNQIFDALLAAKCDRSTVLIALGGGVIGDITGFAAAVYQRGIRFIQMPTTLLAQVDSSVGGKTAINHPLGKNMIGAFHQPVAVIADTDTLATLPKREYASGLAEVVKYGFIVDRAFLDWVEANAARLLQRDPVALAYAIRRSCEIKAQIVAEDERETSGRRALLNLGHTFGHAIEAETGYGTWLHGEAVAAGTVLAARLSAELGLLSAADSERVVRVVKALGLPAMPPKATADALLDHMGRDKKNEGGHITLILLRALGEAVVDKRVPQSRLREFLMRQLALV